jgi:hypothetical protein
MTREEEAFCAEILPCCDEIRQGGTPVFMMFVYAISVAKPIGAIGQMREVPFMILAVFLKCDLRTHLEKWWKEMRIVGNVCNKLRDRGWH